MIAEGSGDEDNVADAEWVVPKLVVHNWAKNTAKWKHAPPWADGLKTSFLSVTAESRQTAIHLKNS